MGGVLIFGAGYGSRTRLHGLGSRCITDIRTLRWWWYYIRETIKIQPLFVAGFLFPDFFFQSD